MASYLALVLAALIIPPSGSKVDPEMAGLAVGPQASASNAPPQKISDGWSQVGVYLGDMTADLARSLGLAEIRGAVVGMVEDGSPAARAGILPNDCILTLDGVTITNRLRFFQALMNTPPGTRIRLGILRGGEQIQIEVETGMRPSPAMLQRRRLFSEADSMLRLAEENQRLAEDALAKGDLTLAARYRETEATFRQMSEDNRAYIENEMREGRVPEPIAVQNLNLNLALASKRYSLGLNVVKLSPQLAAFFRSAIGGLLVTEVRAGGAAEQAGVRAGDCLIRLNNIQLSTTVDFSQAFDRAVVAASQGGPAELILTLVRDGASRTLNLKF